MSEEPAKSVDEYISLFRPEVRAPLKKIRATIRSAAPDAEEVISYRMPALRGNGILIYYAAFKNHIGLYPPVKGNPQLVKAAAKYAGPKGNLQFSYDQPIPYALIARIVKHRVKLDAAKAVPRSRAKSAKQGAAKRQATSKASR